MEFKEISIPVPWGIIAAKLWGDDTNQAAIVLHGYQDNANSFDPLIPLLPKSIFYICVDLPGHGHSSHIPTVSTINQLDFILSLKLVCDHFKRQKYILIGHSFGGVICLLFTQICPEYVTKLISIDSLYTFPEGPEHFVDDMKKILHQYSKITNLKVDTAPSYTLDEITSKMMNFRIVSLTEKGAKVLLPRLITAGNQEGKFRITTDQRLKISYKPQFTIDFQASLVHEIPIKCPFLLIAAKESKLYWTFKEKVVNECEKLPNFEMCEIDGNHNCHIEHPEIVAPIISKFLMKRDSKL